MRPVQKAQVDVPLSPPHEEITISSTYNGHTEAKIPLEANLGTYCSYCEVYSSDLEVEHIISQHQDSNLRHSWTNFLLACGRCNGKDNKTNKPVDLTNMYFPHQNNTLLAFQYLEGGIVGLHPSLTATQRPKAEATLNLLCLDKYPSNPKYPKLKRNDTRWKHRRSAWEIASRYLTKLENNETEISVIIDLALSRGFFSVWFTVFGAYPAVKNALIQAFVGTDRNSFDAQFNPIPRTQHDL
jgi:uncharacterized protein (TIGR02646 family)